MKNLAIRYIKGIQLHCHGCRRTFDLMKEVRRVEESRERIIKCKYCGTEIGKI